MTKCNSPLDNESTDYESRKANHSVIDRVRDIAKMELPMNASVGILEKLVAGTEPCIPIYLDRNEPELEDPSRELADHHWQPGCNTTEKLARCLEAIRDVRSAAILVLSSPSEKDAKRFAKHLITPTYNLAISLRILFNDIQSNHWRRLRDADHKMLKERERRFSKVVSTEKGPLKYARDKISSHLDKDLSTIEYRRIWDSFDLADIVSWISGCIQFLESLLFPDIYSWSRFSGQLNVVNLMNVDTKEVSILFEAGQPLKMLSVRIAKSPKFGIAFESADLVNVVSDLCRKFEIRQGSTWKFPE